MPEIYYAPSGTVTLDGKSYQLVRPEPQKGEPSPLPYKVDNSNEPPWEFRLPDILSEKSLSWDQGGLKSYQGTEQIDTRFTILPPVNISEYGINTDGRWPRRLVPGPRLNSITLPSNTSPITNIWTSSDIWLVVGSPYVWCAAGNNVYYTGLGGSTDGSSAYLAYTSSSDPPLMGIEWQGVVYIVTTTGAIYKATPTIPAGLLPTANGALSQWTPNASTNVSRVQDPINSPDGDTTYNSTNVTGRIDTYTMATFSPPASAGLGYVLMSVVIRRTTSGVTDATIRGVCRIGGVNYFTAAAPVPAGSTSYSASSGYLFGGFASNPATGAQWTAAAINAAEWGYELTTLGDAANLRTTQFFIAPAYLAWTTTDATANWLAAGPRRLFKIYDGGSTITLRNIAPSIDPLTEANWGDDVIIPGTNVTGINIPLTAYQKTAIVATDKGVFGVDDDGTGTKIIERLTYSIKSMSVQDPYLYISHGHGISRWLPGLVQSTGIEQEIENESVVKGTVTAMTFLGKWTFIAITPPTGNNHILVGRDRESADGPNYGPMVWDTLIETGNSETIYSLAVGKFGTQFGLFYEKGNDLGFCLFPETGGIPEIDSPSYLFSTSGIRYSPRYKFRDVRDKNFYKLLVRGKNNTASILWSIAYQIDDSGSWSTVDILGNSMVVNADTLFEYKLPIAATGQYIQFRFTYTSNDNTKRSWINYFEVMAIPQGHKIQEVSFALLLADNINHVDNEIETRDVSTQYSDLETLMSSAAPIQGTGFFGNGTYLYPRDMKLLQVTQQDFHEGEQVVQVTFRIRE